MFRQISDATSDADLIDLVVAGESSRNSFDASQAFQMLTYVDRSRAAGEKFGGSLIGKLEASAAAHELSLALTLPVATVENQLATARRMRSTMPTVWEGWHSGNVSTRKVTLIDQAAQRFTQSSSVGMLDAVIVEIASTPGNSNGPPGSFARGSTVSLNGSRTRPLSPGTDVPGAIDAYGSRRSATAWPF